MKTLPIILIPFLVLTIFSCDTNNVESLNDNRVRDFEAITVYVPGNITIEIGEEPSVFIKAPQDQLDLIDYRVRNGELIIDQINDRSNSSNDYRLDKDEIEIIITTPELNKIDVLAETNIDVIGIINSDRLEVITEDEVAVTFDEVNTSELILKLHARGSIAILSGVVENGDIVINGIGEIRTFGVTHEKCKATINREGLIEVTVDSELDAFISNLSGSIFYKGDPVVSRSGDGRDEIIKK